ncbi:hypothetical protein J3A78_002130 [Streptomyces sp. PvR006]|uniref:DUF6907 domain-containing protein n=1 Tax=Streptomyces sp. PvR006 TaxID=2817860 RepID=UPI001AE950EB|nr:hypothetical protein [Streptomyces sp. PvR006]MBP2581652.1 hypothetical protein [Streptomyces sp. PvR006]
MSERDPLEGIPDALLDWHKGALEGDLAVCAAPQPGYPNFPCINNRASHARHRDVLGRTWPLDTEEPLYVARRSPVVDGMVTVETRDHGAVTLPEPEWCRGFHTEGGYRSDIEHASEEEATGIPTLCHDLVDVLGVSLVQRPFSPSAPQVHALVKVDEEVHALNSRGLDVAAALLVEHAATMRHLARKLAALEVQR